MSAKIRRHNRNRSTASLRTKTVEEREALSSEIVRLAAEGRERFLRIGRLLRKHQDELQETAETLRLLDVVIKGAGISRRTAQYWIEIDRTYSSMGISEARLIQLGWAKLSAMAKHVNALNVDHWLTLAETNSLLTLRTLLKGDAKTQRTILLKLQQSEYSFVVHVLLRHGATQRGRKLLMKKEAAIVKICELVEKTFPPASTPQPSRPHKQPQRRQLVVEKNIPFVSLQREARHVVPPLPNGSVESGSPRGTADTFQDV